MYSDFMLHALSLYWYAQYTVKTFTCPAFEPPLFSAERKISTIYKKPTGQKPTSPG
jgi:hypothetical protein